MVDFRGLKTWKRCDFQRLKPSKMIMRRSSWWISSAPQNSSYQFALEILQLPLLFKNPDISKKGPENVKKVRFPAPENVN